MLPLSTSVAVAGPPASPTTQIADVVVPRGGAIPPTRPLTQAPSGAFSFIVDSTWSAADRATLESWTAPGSPELTALNAVAGPPPGNITVTVSQGPVSSGFAGEYNLSTHTVQMPSLDLAVFMHELNHATHDQWVIRNSVWEEGMARAAEVAEMSLLAQAGVPEAQGYWDAHHQYPYDQRETLLNVPDIGVVGGSIIGLGDSALTLTRYELAGYALAKPLLENAGFIRSFNAQLFQATPDTELSAATLVGLATQVTPNVEGQPFAAWYLSKQIFDQTPPGGCRLLNRPTPDYVVDVFCRISQGDETPQAGVPVTLVITSTSGAVLYNAAGTTNSLGAYDFSPIPSISDNGRLRVVSTARLPTGQTLTQTMMRTNELDEQGVFGVATPSLTGTVTFTSATGQFASFSVPVSDGAYRAPSLDGVAGQIVASYQGGGVTLSRTFDKDASAYEVDFTQPPVPGVLNAQFIAGSMMSTDPATPTVPQRLVWTRGSCASGASYTLLGVLPRDVVDAADGWVAAE